MQPRDIICTATQLIAAHGDGAMAYAKGRSRAMHHDRRMAGWWHQVACAVGFIVTFGDHLP